MEAIAMVRNWADFGPAADIFRALRADKCEQMVLDDNYFVEQRLPAGVLRTLSAEEMATYRASFQTREDRLPTLALPREIPVDGKPADVSAIVDAYGAWLAQSEIPKLLILAEGGVWLRHRENGSCRYANPSGIEAGGA
jgi:haloalkane dehalogenase